MVYQNLFENLNQPILVFDSYEKNIILTNPAASETLGYSANELVDKSLAGLFPESIIKFIEPIFNSMAESNLTSAASIPFLSQNNDIIYLDINASKMNLGSRNCLVFFLCESKTKNAVIDSSSNFKLAVNASTDVIILTDNSGRIKELNPKAQMLLKLDEDTSLEQYNAFSLIFKDNEEKKNYFVKQAISQEKRKFFEWSLVDLNNELVPLEVSISLIRDNEEKKSGFIIIGRDISERKKNELEIRKSLYEKDYLLKEIHHRVKNNLQVIHSILSLQARYIDAPEIIKVIEESQDRIKSMSFIHEYLYQSKDLSKIDMNHYIEKLCEYLHLSYSDSEKNISIKMNCQNLKVDLQTATPCGLIINELISNSLKHAFKDAQQGMINITFALIGKEYILNVKDNGKGFDDEVKIASSNSLGIRLIKILTEQLQGTVSFYNNDGAVCEIKFPKV